MPNPTIDTLTVNGSTYDIVDTTSGYMTSLVTLTYGTSTWNDFITAYNAKKIVYCHVSGRMAFMAYVNNSGNNPTEVEFQYVRSRNGHTDNYQGDQVYVYKLTSAGTWTTTTRNSYTKIDTEKGLTDTYTTGTVDSVSGQGILKIKPKLRSETALTVDSASATTVSGRVYPVALDKSGYLAVNVPWESGSGGTAKDWVEVSPTEDSTNNWSWELTWSSSLGTIPTYVEFNIRFNDEDFGSGLVIPVQALLFRGYSYAEYNSQIPISNVPWDETSYDFVVQPDMSFLCQGAIVVALHADRVSNPTHRTFTLENAYICNLYNYNEWTASDIHIDDLKVWEYR